MSQEPSVIKGGSHTDNRGTIYFHNEFDMSVVKRFYVIEHPSTSIVRAWRAHRIEQRWFTVINGEFLIRLVKIDDWEMPSPTLPINDLNVSGLDNVLHVPPGYATWIQALKDNSKLLIFSDYSIDHAVNDDYLYPQNYFTYTNNEN